MLCALDWWLSLCVAVLALAPSCTQWRMRSSSKNNLCRVSTVLVLLATAPPVPISNIGMAVPVCLMIGCVEGWGFGWWDG